MNISYTEKEISNFYHYYYEWIDFLDLMYEPSKVIENYEGIENCLKEKFISVGWEQENDIKLIWIPPFAVGSIILGGDEAFLKKYGSKIFDNGKLCPNAWTKGIFLFHAKNSSDGTSIILSPIELDIPNYGL